MKPKAYNHEARRRRPQQACNHTTHASRIGGGGRGVNKQHQQPAAPGNGGEQPQLVDLLVTEAVHLEEQVSGFSHTTQASRTLLYANAKDTSPLVGPARQIIISMAHIM